MQKDLFQHILEWKLSKVNTKGRILKAAGEKRKYPTKESPLGNKQISQQKFYRPGESRITYSKNWKIKAPSQEYPTWKSYSSDMKEK